MKLIILALSLFLLSPTINADGVGKIYKEEKVTKNAEVVRPTIKHGALYPSPTYNLWDGKDRPKYWNGYGVDPSDQNYYYYFNKHPCNYEFMRGEELCKFEEDEVKNIPEPTVTAMFALGIVTFLIWSKYGKEN